MSLDQKTFVSVSFLHLGAKVINDEERRDDIMSEIATLGNKQFASITEGEAQAWKLRMMDDIRDRGVPNPSKFFRVRDNFYNITSCGRAYLDTLCKEQ